MCILISKIDYQNEKCLVQQLYAIGATATKTNQYDITCLYIYNIIITTAIVSSTRVRSLPAMSSTIAFELYSIYFFN